MDRLHDYYSGQRALFEEIAGGSDIYNLGFAPPGFRGDFAAAQRELVFRVIDSVGMAPGSLVLDLGSGRGGPARLVAKRCSVRVIGLEPLSEQLSRCNPGLRTRATADVRLIQGEAGDIPFNENVFDGAWSIESAFHYPDKSAFISEAARVLKAGAYLAVADIVMDDGYENHWTHNGFRRALASPGLFTVSLYRDAAIRAGLEPLHAYDLTAGVMRSLRLVGLKLLSRIPALARTGYPIGFLLLAQAAFFHLEYTHRLIPAKYRLFIFRKPV